MQINFVKNFTFGIGNTNKNLYHLEFFALSYGRWI